MDCAIVAHCVAPLPSPARAYRAPLEIGRVIIFRDASVNVSAPLYLVMRCAFVKTLHLTFRAAHTMILKCSSRDLNLD